MRCIEGASVLGCRCKHTSRCMRTRSEDVPSEIRGSRPREWIWVNIRVLKTTNLPISSLCRNTQWTRVYTLESGRHNGRRQRNTTIGRESRIFAQTPTSAQTSNPATQYRQRESMHRCHEHSIGYVASEGEIRSLGTLEIVLGRRRTDHDAGCWASQGYTTQGCAALEQSLRACMDARV